MTKKMKYDGKMVEVKSSNIAEVGFKGDEVEGTLTVKFKHGKAYEYEAVPTSEYLGLIQAGSVGSYFAAHVRNKFAYRPIGA